MSSVIGIVGVLLGVALGAWLTRRQSRKAQAERLLVEALNDTVAAIAGIAGGEGVEAQRRYASAVGRVALHGSPEVIRAFRRFQDDATTSTESGRARLLEAVRTARADLGHRAADDSDVSVLLFGAGPVTVDPWAAEVFEQVGENVKPVPADAPPLDPKDRAALEFITDSDPALAMSEGFRLIEQEVRHVAREVGLPHDGSVRDVATALHEAGRISVATLSAIAGMEALRDHTVEDTKSATADDTAKYLRYVERLLYALSVPPHGFVASNESNAAT